ncbi:hypothetical protein KR044_003504 [Drosophila immigrans]|nr:hypothetical protein KR044_003504 [Drosophila immigrans]
MQAKQKPKEKCVSQKDQLIKLEGLSRDTDNFWLTDLSPPSSKMSGRKYLNFRNYNKGLAFSHRERQLLNIHGLLPAAVLTMEQQVKALQNYYGTLSSELAKYIFLTDLESNNKTLFFSFLMSNPPLYMKVFQSSVTGFLVKEFSGTAIVFRGLFINIKDRGHIYNVLRNWPQCKSVRCLIVGNGKSVLSWGDQGVNGTPVIIYKMYSNVVHGGINPKYCLPITLDVGTDNEQLLQNRYYCGLRQKRVTGAEFDEFFEEFTHAVVRLYGSRCIIQTKDFGVSDAIKHLTHLRNQQCIMDLDLQPLGACGLAGVLGAIHITQLALKDNVLLFHGDTSFCIGMARMCVAYLKRSGLNEAAAKSNIWFYDGKGLVVYNRGPKITERMEEFQQVHAPVEGIVESIDAVKPNILIGFGLGERAFTKEVLRAMERSAQQPIIFAMSRPLDMMECTPEDAFVHTKGRCIFVSGISLPSLKYANKVYQPGYCTSDYIIPGLTLGVMLSGMTSVPDETFLVAAERLAKMVWPTDLAKRDVYAPLRKIRCINMQIADAVLSFAYRRGLATLWPEPENSMHYIQSKVYNNEYSKVIPEIHCMFEPKIGTEESLLYYKESI